MAAKLSKPKIMEALSGRLRAAKARGVSGNSSRSAGKIDLTRLFRSGKTGGVNRAIALVSALIFIAVIAAGSIYIIKRINDPYNIKPIPGQDPNAVNGSLADNDEIPVEKGSYRMILNMTPRMESGSSSCDLNIVNVLGNSYVVKVIVLDDGGGVLYTSGYIQPGQSMKEVRLEKNLAAGVHEATVTYLLFEPGTLEQSGSTGAAITITVLE